MFRVREKRFSRLYGRAFLARFIWGANLGRSRIVLVCKIFELDDFSRFVKNLIIATFFQSTRTDQNSSTNFKGVKMDHLAH